MTRSFQLIKRYASGVAWVERPIEKPVEGTVVLAVDGAGATEFAVDVTTGLVTFDPAPADGAVLTAGFAFDVPVRFDADQINVALAGTTPCACCAPLVEIAG